MNPNPVLDALYTVGKFHRFELIETLKRGGTLEPQQDWAVVVDTYHLILRHRTSLQPSETKFLENMFSELQQNLNSVADIFRKISMLKSTPTFNEPLYLTKANGAIAKAQQEFQGQLSVFEKRYKPNDSEEKPLSDRVLHYIKNNPILAFLVVLGVVVTAIGAFTEGIDKTWEFVEKRWPKTG